MTTPVHQLLHAKARRQLPSLCAEHRRLSDDITTLTDDKKMVMEEITLLAQQAGVRDTVAGDGWQLIHNTGRCTLNPTKLLELGVAADVIQRAKVRGKAFYQVRKLDDD